MQFYCIFPSDKCLEQYIFLYHLHFSENRNFSFHTPLLKNNFTQQRSTGSELTNPVVCLTNRDSEMLLSHIQKLYNFPEEEMTAI